jgi:ketosteroid isomerase-like protein
MSEENVTVVGALYEHFNRVGEPPWELFEPDAEFDATNVVGLGVLRGREQVLGAMRDYAASWERWSIEPEKFIDAGEHVVVVVRDGGRLKATGDEVFNRFVHLWTFRAGKVVRWKTFLDEDQAVEAAGLSE